MRVFALVVAAMGLDLLTFALVGTGQGIYEMNPIMARGDAVFGLTVIALLKVTAVVAICILLLRVKHARVRLWTAYFGAAFGLLGAFGNVTAALR